MNTHHEHHRHHRHHPQHRHHPHQHRRRAIALVAVAAAAGAALTACASSNAAGPGSSSTSTITGTSTSTVLTTPPTTAPVTTVAPARPTGVVDERVPVGGASMHIACAGSGNVTVLLLAGFGDGQEAWTTVQPELTTHTRVCAPSRFGTGTSDPPPRTQTFVSQAADLRALLDAAGEPGPYVVVGHSFGGAEAVAFTAANPDLVTGLVLVDASPPRWNATLCSFVEDSDVGRSFQAACAMQADPAANPEHLDGPAAFAEIGRITTLGDVPMTVLTGRVRSYPEGPTRVWNEGQAQWASLSSAASLVPVDNTGHYIQIDQPAIVIEQVLALVS